MVECKNVDYLPEEAVLAFWQASFTGHPVVVGFGSSIVRECINCRKNLLIAQIDHATQLALYMWHISFPKAVLEFIFCKPCCDVVE
jgi:hypothetical protein